jgi:hypothetical protein
VAPEALAIGGAHAIDDFLFADAVEENELVAEDGGGGEAFAFFHFPHGAQSVGGEVFQQRGLGGDHVVRRAKEGWPIGGDGAGCEGLGCGVEGGVRVFACGRWRQRAACRGGGRSGVGEFFLL